MLKSYGNLIVIYILEFLCKVFYVIPVNKKRVLFMAFACNQYSCSPKYIFQLLQETCPDLEFIWVFNTPDKYDYLKAANVKVIKNHSLASCIYLLTSKVIITNTISGSWVPFRKSQTVINTWHGGGAYKKSGPFVEKLSAVSRHCIYRTSKKNTHFVSSCQAFTKKFLKEAFHYEGNILEYGLPRNDIFWKDSSDIAAKVKGQLHIPPNNKVVLYAPTYRDDKKKWDNPIDLSLTADTIKARFGGEWTVVCRTHYFLRSGHKQDRNHSLIDATFYPDMQELLCMADILITDYSSSIWDFSHTGKPCFLYAPDLHNYVGQRDFFVPIEQWHFPLAESNEQLAYIIQSFDMERYLEDMDRHHSEYESFEHGTATSSIVKLISNICFGK